MKGCKYKVLDGGLSTELIGEFKHTEIVRDPLWSARLIATHPQDIMLAHERFLSAGADLLETCTYQASLEGFQKHMGVSPSEAAELLQQAVSLCIKTRDNFWSKSSKKLQKEKPLVVGSVGPYGASLADRSEYSGNYVDALPDELLKDWHRPLVRHIWSSGVDLVAFETLPAKKEALAILDLLREFPDTKAWLSFSCKDESLNNHGENMESVAEEILMKHGCNSGLVGIGMNCSSQNIAGGIIRKIRSVLGKSGKTDDIAVVCYPDGGGTWLPDGSWTKGHHKLENHVAEWLDAGAQWIGGCCMSTPDDIFLIRKAVDRHIQLTAVK